MTTFQIQSHYQRIGGEEPLRTLVQRFGRANLQISSNGVAVFLRRPMAAVLWRWES